MREASCTEQDVRDILDALEVVFAPDDLQSIEIRDKHSNYVVEVRFRGGRTLMIKRVRYAEMAERFHTSRVAAELLREEAGITAPDYLTVPAPFDVPLVYWRIPLPTLDTLWPDLSEEARRVTLRSWGALIRRIQRVRLPGHGPLLAARREARSLAAFLHADLEERLRPAAEGIWPEGLALIDRLIAAIDAVQQQVGDRGGVLLHNDLFTSNVLCERAEEDGETRATCVGVLDLEDAFAGPPEAELAKTEILHGPLFGHSWQAPYFEEILTGYAAPLDPLLMAFFRTYHMVNMGFHAAATGLAAHAGEVARAGALEMDAAGSGRRHRDVVAALWEAA